MAATDSVVNIIANPLLAGVTSFTSTLGLAAGALPVPDTVPGWLPYLVSIAGPVLMAVVVRVLAAVAARARALAQSKEERAKALRGDKNPENDPLADKLEDEAAALRAQAAALEAARKPPGVA